MKELRKKFGYTQEEFAQIVGCSISTVRAWEQGRSEPPDYAKNLIKEKLASKGKKLPKGKDFPICPICGKTMTASKRLFSDNLDIVDFSCMSKKCNKEFLKKLK